ncbi:hypothetical protein [Paludibacter sp.]|nr:hypothetical protein [Paludibacter sp.]
MKGMVEHLLASIDEVEKEIEKDVFMALVPLQDAVKNRKCLHVDLQ